MTKEQCRARIVEFTLAGRQFSPLEKAQIKAGVCRSCGHTMSKTLRSYDQQSGAKFSSRFSPRVISCECGRCQGLWLWDRLWGTCDRCKTIPSGVWVEYEAKPKKQGDYVVDPGGQRSFWKFICECGLHEPRRSDANRYKSTDQVFLVAP